MKKSTFLFATLFSCACLKAKATTYNPYQVFQKNRVDVNLQTQFFKTESNFSSTGSKTDLPSGNYLQNIEFTPSVRWEFIEDLGIIAGFNVAAAESSDALATRKNSTLNRIDIGADYFFWNSDIHESFFRLIYSHPLEKADSSTDSVFNSDGVSEIQPEVVIRFDFAGVYPYGQMGLNFRSGGLSTLLTYTAGAEARFSEIGLGASVRGYKSITDDSKTNTPADRDLVNARVNGGSMKYFSVNPNLTEAELNLNFAMSESLLFKVFGAYAIIGSNTAAGYTAGVSLNFNFLTAKKFSRATSVPEHKEELRKQPSSPQFKEDTQDGVNQEYFKPVQPPAQKNYIQQVEGQPQSLKNATTPETNEQLKEQQEIKNKLNDIEYSLKLKKMPKKKKKKTQ